MSAYETLKGLKVKYLSADTSGDRLQEGELFYNSTDGGLKSHIAVGAFSAGGNMLTARRAMTGGAGTQTAGLIAGGYVSALITQLILVLNHTSLWVHGHLVDIYLLLLV